MRVAFATRIQGTGKGARAPRRWEYRRLACRIRARVPVLPGGYGAILANERGGTEVFWKSQGTFVPLQTVMVPSS